MGTEWLLGRAGLLWASRGRGSVGGRSSPTMGPAAGTPGTFLWPLLKDYGRDSLALKTTKAIFS